MTHNKYITVMFPYPSGAGLHVGHVYNYAIVDSYCKIQKYKGNSVFQPFGFDAFGLPAENYARKIGGDPRVITYQNIDTFRNEMKRMDTSYEELLITSDPSYMKWTQWIFTKLQEHGLAYKANRGQSYCPSCETVLAREQVIKANPTDAEGHCERCNTKVEEKVMLQWFFKITDYKQRLIDDLDKVDYPEKTKKQQRNWLEKLEDWCVSRQRSWGCPIPVEGEMDTLDTFVDSSFYTIRYCDPNNDSELVAFDKARPVDVYVGGNEHACMHLIYARFITKFLFDIGVIPFDEPFNKVIHQGMILKDNEKMSKSKGNVVNPAEYEPQELRMYLMFINHYFDGGSWSDNNFKGVQKFIKRMNVWFGNKGDDGVDMDITDFKNTVIAYFDSWKTNKVVSEWMTFYNKNKNTKLSTSSVNELRVFFNTCF